MVSIRYKALLPMALLAAVLLALVGTAAISLTRSLDLQRSLASRYQEIEEVRQLEVAASQLVAPFIAFSETGAREHADAVYRTLSLLDENVHDLLGMAVVNSSERVTLERIEHHLRAIHQRAAEFFDSGLADRSAVLHLLHGLSEQHLRELAGTLKAYHDDEIRQVDELVAQAEALQAQFHWVAAVTLGVTGVLFAMAIWLNNRLLVEPILRISRSASGIAEGRPAQVVSVTSNDELGRLAGDIHRMAGSLQSMVGRLDALAHSDPLTGLLNRRAFDQAIARELAAARRSPSDLAIVMVDVDHFKRINDAHGHAVGDEVLKFVARVCGDTLRARDAMFRIGGEEFVLLLQQAGAEQGARVAERCRASLAAVPWTDGVRVVAVSASFGVAQVRDAASSPAQLLADADAALYAAKRKGRNRVEVHRPTGAEDEPLPGLQSPPAVTACGTGRAGA